MMFMNIQKVLQQLSNCESKNEVKKMLRNNRDSRDLYKVLKRSISQLQKMKHVNEL